MPDVRIVSGDQNHAPITAATVRPLGQSNPLDVSLTGASGEQLTFNGVEFKKVYYDVDANNNTTYAGRYKSANAVSGDQDCVISKYTYDVNNNVRKQQTLTGSWTNHSSLAWES